MLIIGGPRIAADRIPDRPAQWLLVGLGLGSCLEIVMILVVMGGCYSNLGELFGVDEHILMVRMSG